MSVRKLASSNWLSRLRFSAAIAAVAASSPAARLVAVAAMVSSRHHAKWRRQLIPKPIFSW
jgi:hypothetical protein